MKLPYLSVTFFLAFQLTAGAAYAESEESGFTFPGQVPGKERHIPAPKPQPQPFDFCGRFKQSSVITNDKIKALEEERATMLAAVGGDQSRFSEKEKRKYNAINGNVVRFKAYIEKGNDKCSNGGSR